MLQIKKNFPILGNTGEILWTRSLILNGDVTMLLVLFTFALYMRGYIR